MPRRGVEPPYSNRVRRNRGRICCCTQGLGKADPELVGESRLRSECTCIGFSLAQSLSESVLRSSLFAPEARVSRNRVLAALALSDAHRIDVAPITKIGLRSDIAVAESAVLDGFDGPKVRTAVTDGVAFFDSKSVDFGLERFFAHTYTT